MTNAKSVTMWQKNVKTFITSMKLGLTTDTDSTRKKISRGR